MIQKLVVNNLTELSTPQFIALRDLKDSKQQEIFGKSFTESIDDWELAYQGNRRGLCFLLEDQPIGLTLFKKQGAYTASIHGLKIATPWQRRGFGRFTFQLAVEHLKCCLARNNDFNIGRGC